MDAFIPIVYITDSTCSMNSLESGCISNTSSFVTSAYLYKTDPVAYYIVVKRCDTASIPFVFGVHNGVYLLVQSPTQFNKGEAKRIIITLFKAILGQNNKNIPIGAFLRLTSCSGTKQNDETTFGSSLTGYGLNLV